MMPRPRSRKRPVERMDAGVLAAEIERLRQEGLEPAAIITGIREWALVRTQPAAAAHLEYWPGGDQTYAKVPVIIRRDLDTPAIMPTQQELEDALLGSG